MIMNFLHKAIAYWDLIDIACAWLVYHFVLYLIGLMRGRFAAK